MVSVHEIFNVLVCFQIQTENANQMFRTFVSHIE
jgi:hypothetical protein